MSATTNAKIIKDRVSIPSTLNGQLKSTVTQNGCVV